MMSVISQAQSLSPIVGGFAPLIVAALEKATPESLLETLHELQDILMLIEHGGKMGEDDA
jgi:hypothetical protein